MPPSFPVPPPGIRRVCIVGAGAVGCFVGTRLAARVDLQVGALARGATRAALQRHGWRLEQADGALLQAPCAGAADDAAVLGEQDLVVIALKAPALPGLAPRLAPLIGPHTVVLPAMNGVPWWFEPGEPLASVDPGGVVRAALPPAHVLGCVVHASVALREPGFAQQRSGQRLVVGEPAGGASARADALAALLRQAGFDVEPSADIRREVWFKLWGNLVMNPVSAITGASGDRILADPLVRAFCSRAMAEAQALGARLGCAVDGTPEERHRVTERLGAFRTSMLQDAEAGRPIELDAIVGAVRELGQRHGVPTPSIDALFGLARLFGRVRGIYPAE